MKKLFAVIAVVLVSLSLCAFTSQKEEKPFDIDNLYDYQKEFKSEEIPVCAENTTKTYMDYRATTATDSRQYWFIKDELTVDEETGFLYDKDGFIAVALGSFYGEIGDRYYFTLESGIVLPLVKAEEKADQDTDYSGCYHTSDGSVIEFVIDRNLANNYFGYYNNGYVLQGNYNNYSLFRGRLVKVERVLDEKNESYVTYADKDIVEFDNTDIFNYASGY